MDSIIEKCEWDSEFFGLMIGKAVIKNKDDYTTLISSGDSEPYNLIYIFADNNIDVFPGCSFVDEKVVYSKQIQSFEEIEDAHICLINGDAPDDSLIALVLQSGEYSRFRIDQHFPKDSYEKLYRRWIEKYFSGETGQYVFGYYDEFSLSGFLTLSITENKANIGLLAVDAGHRHRGIGSKLLTFLTAFLYKQEVEFVTVATQATNQNACSLYEKNGYTRISSTPIYHWWK